MESVAEERTTEERSSFIWSKLGSAVAVVPLGVWTVVHVWNNLSAFRGPDAWQAAVTSYAHPLAHAATLVIVLLPLLIHTIWGLQRLKASRPNNTRYGFYANLKYLLQRASAAGILLFLGAHIWLAMLKPRLAGHPEFFADIACQMRWHVPTLVVYLLGTLGVAYHLGNGLGTFAMGWGIAWSRKGLKRAEYVSIGTFLILTALSWAAIYALFSQSPPLEACTIP